MKKMPHLKESQSKGRLILLFTVVLMLSIILVLGTSCSTGPEQNIVSDAYYNVGNSAFSAGNYKQAEEYYITAISYNPDNRSASYNLALTYTLNGKFLEAENLFLQLLADDPDNIIVLNSAAWNIYKSGNPEKALEDYESILRITPAYDELRLNCIRVSLEIGDFARADYHLGYLFDNSTLNFDMLFLRGEFFFHQNDDEAGDWYISALEKDSGNIDAESRIEEILQSELTEKSILKLYTKLNNAGLLSPDLLYEISLRLLSIGEISGFTYLREAVLLGFDITQIMRTDFEILPEPIYNEFLEFLIDEFARKFQ